MHFLFHSCFYSCSFLFLVAQSFFGMIDLSKFFFCPSVMS